MSTDIKKFLNLSDYADIRECRNPSCDREFLPKRSDSIYCDACTGPGKYGQHKAAREWWRRNRMKTKPRKEELTVDTVFRRGFEGL